MTEINREIHGVDSKDQFADSLEQLGHSSESLDDDSRNKLLNRRLLCLVCGAHARGYNFGVTACESCKAFFRRNALRNEMRPCCHGGNCGIKEENRKACPACRIKKCFEVGMKKELIHPPERLMMRAKPRSWHHSRRFVKAPNDGTNSTNSPSNDQDLQNSKVPIDQLKRDVSTPPQKDIYGNGISLPDSNSAIDRYVIPTSTIDGRIDNQCSLLMSIIDKNAATTCTNEKNSSNKQSTFYVDTGITCCPMTDIDDSYYYLSAKFNYILGMAKGPFSYNPSENAVELSVNPDTVEDGFAMYEYIIKRMVSTLVHMPHFNTIERCLFIDIVKEKLFGAAQIFSCLYFNPSLESWVMLMSRDDGVIKEVTLECSTFFYNAFRYLTKPCGMSSVAILKMGDVDTIFKANMNSFKRICNLSQNNGVFMIALIGYYLTIDEGFVHSGKVNNLEDIMKAYERFLMQMRSVISGDFDVCEFYRDILGLMQLVKWIETRYVDLGKYLEKDRLPPLLKEIMSDDGQKDGMNGPFS